MHIAICDDNIADRKQSERLLARESERRKNGPGGLLYVRSYGHQDALLKAPMQYDLFLIDLVKDGADGLELALALCAKGVGAPIALAVSVRDYRAAHATLSEPPPNIFFIDKPLVAAEVTALIDRASQIRSEAAPTIELRTGSDTLYLLEKDIVCGIGDGRQTDVFMADGHSVRVAWQVSNLYEHICFYPSFFRISTRTFINVTYVSTISPFGLRLENGRRFFISPLVSRRLQAFMTPVS